MLSYQPGNMKAVLLRMYVGMSWTQHTARVSYYSILLPTSYAHANDNTDVYKYLINNWCLFCKWNHILLTRSYKYILGYIYTSTCTKHSVLFLVSTNLHDTLFLDSDRHCWNCIIFIVCLIYIHIIMTLYTVILYKLTCSFWKSFNLRVY